MNSHSTSDEKGAIIVPIPHSYVWLTEGYHDRPKLFKQYVAGYVQSIGYQLIEINGMNAICERR
ncbi:hypothetical protein [Metabacillus fastidiosus]|uniref:hypothetical protein n=1 Tax=Metabacillus fastidiosus TaxID=1458 RepID=UPI002E22E6C6|nr:hypothetical protein [Metabacillus fastidiosus]